MAKRTQPPEIRRTSSGRLFGATPEDLAKRWRRIKKIKEELKPGRRFASSQKVGLVLLTGDMAYVTNPSSRSKETVARFMQDYTTARTAMSKTVYITSGESVAHSEPDYAAELIALIQRLDAKSQEQNLEMDALLSRLRTTRIVA